MYLPCILHQITEALQQYSHIRTAICCLPCHAVLCCAPLLLCLLGDRGRRNRQGVLQQRQQHQQQLVLLCVLFVLRVIVLELLLWF